MHHSALQGTKIEILKKWGNAVKECGTGMEKSWKKEVTNKCGCCMEVSPRSQIAAWLCMCRSISALKVSKLDYLSGCCQSLGLKSWSRSCWQPFFSVDSRYPWPFVRSKSLPLQSPEISIPPHRIFIAFVRFRGLIALH
nr:hypothetical protein Iba_chr14cCG10420 [Ipomoea batatas]